jgi:Fic family protein
MDNTDHEDGSGGRVVAGEYRKTPMSVGGGLYFAPQWERVPELMQKFVATTNEALANTLDSYLLAAWIMSKFVDNHPFEDGNGRMCDAQTRGTFCGHVCFFEAIPQDHS